MYRRTTEIRSARPHRDRVPAKLREALEHLVLRSRVERRGGLVPDDHLGLAHVGARERHLLPLTTRELDPAIEPPAELGVEARLEPRGQRVMLDAHLAELYGVATKVLNRAVTRNQGRFPEDFVFRLSSEEMSRLKFQIGTSNVRPARGGRRYLPYVFTEQGVAMLSSVLHSERAIRVNVEIMRAFVRLRALIGSHAGLARKLEQVEEKYDAQFKEVFDAIRDLMRQPDSDKPKEIGFRTSAKT